MSTSALRISPGACRSEDDASNIVLPAVINLSGLAPGNSQHRHALVCMTTGGAAATQLSAAIALPFGWATYLRIGSIFTNGSGDIREFRHNGDHITFASPVLDVQSTITTESFGNLSMPRGVVSYAELFFNHAYAGDANYLICDPADTLAVSSTHRTAFTTAMIAAAPGWLRGVRADTQGPVRLACTITGTTLALRTQGYDDHRGRDR